MLSSITGVCVCVCVCVYKYRIESPIKIAPKSADDTSEFEDYDDDEVILPSPPHPTTPYPLPTPHSILHVLVPAKCHYLAPHQYLYVEFEYFHSRDLSRASIFPGPFPPSSPLFFPIPSTPSTHTPLFLLVFQGPDVNVGPVPPDQQKVFAKF